MTGRMFALLAVVGGLVLLACGGTAAATVVAWVGDQQTPAVTTSAAPAGYTACGTPSLDPRPAAATTVSGYSADQVANATTIVRVGQQLQVPPRGWVIAVATAMQEASLHNPGNLGAANDHDSLGLFQQRPSQGWGSPAQVMDPEHAATSFYQHLLAIHGWQSLPLTAAAQAVQRSAFPNAYAKHEAAAAALVGTITGGAHLAATTAGTCATAGQVTAGGWTNPVPGATVGSGFGPRGKEFHRGQDLITPKRTVIRAASDGTVIEAHCDPSTAAARSCDQDGGVDVPGCGWIVKIRHAGGVITVYCHMIVKPLVAVGQQIGAGQQIGWSGTSGHSSGPHVHFEVHLNGDPSNAGAVDPVPFMREHGAPLGGS